eukprot:CAMPEP_0202382388 /NCGR_PEP_ID=MMETSP1127-20130417/42808_1 /ASSEMBLY_ACC=CAM_ASM_000462 /TAXON_ID=3047 /ORGANISM="Dunaliella tertiolecta, Strain CCMP1320" /LENGTH=57 /DNA_ID=CAMNT_0048981585 /DNA_START=47 /DNA_END=220 /DNA_ORIENTATION=+
MSGLMVDCLMTCAAVMLFMVASWAGVSSALFCPMPFLIANPSKKKPATTPEMVKILV